MRMAGPDIVLFVVGLVLFGGASYAIYALDEDPGGAASSLGVFQVTFSPETVEVGSENVASLRSASATFDLNESHPLRVLVVIECAGGPAQLGAVPFQMQASIEGPSGQTAEGSGQCGQTLVLEVPVGSLPEDTVAQGDVESDARANLPRSADAANATGEWTVTVSGSRGQQTPAAIPVVDPAGIITLNVEIAQPRFAPVQR